MNNNPWPFRREGLLIMPPRALLRRAFLLLLGLRAARSSAGDREHGYHICVEECLSSEWEPTTTLLLLGWTATADCRYECTWNRTAWRLARGEPPLQYHGKWPFYRLLGVQVSPANFHSCACCRSHEP